MLVERNPNTGRCEDYWNTYPLSNGSSGMAGMMLARIESLKSFANKKAYSSQKPKEWR
jgi:hypothetical protein